ncbi:MAG TPA: hypothetical protein VMT66_06285 [Steroidobacteraceae bacterium]|nr:hypothetical protein [Steroidobacteraceae bacterium]
MVPATAFAASAFDGTWKQNLDSVKTTGKPDVYLLANGEYLCSSCSPELKVKADGAEHKVSGHAYYDTTSVKVTGPNSDEQLLKQGDKSIARIVESVSADGNTLTQHITSYAGAKPVTVELTEKRVAPAPAGAHPVSGSWQPAAFKGDETARTVKYRMTTDGFQMHWNGQSYDAKFDGKEYPIVGDPGKTTVSLKKLDANSVEETDRRQGKVVDEIHLAASQDGKSIAVTDKDVAHGQTTTYTLEKQ